MSKRDDLLVSIADTIQDYQASNLPTPEHVDRWIKQFDKSVQIAMLREMDHVLKQTYVSLAHVASFLEGLHKTEKLTGEDPCAFWKRANFLEIQDRGNSQTEMLELFDALLKEKCSIGVKRCGEADVEYVYLDDGIYTGNRIIQDIKPWIDDNAPTEAKVHIITIVLHNGGHYYAQGKLKDAVKNAKKNIAISWWQAIALEDRKTHTSSSDVLRPVAIPEDNMVQAYVDAMKHKPTLRRAGHVGNRGIFSSDEGRQLLEQEFLKAGVRIREMCPNLNRYQRPLGNSVLETLGFGSLFVTFRNCPNNAPLALWVGDPWYPLFPRTTNSQTEIRRLFEDLTKDEGQ